MKLGYIFLYVPDPARSAAFYEKAFGLERSFATPCGHYLEMKTGGVTLAFASYTLREENQLGEALDGAQTGPAAAELSFISDNLEAAYARALAAGGISVHAPSVKPWGQTVARLRDVDGFPVEICTPMAPPAPEA